MRTDGKMDGRADGRRDRQDMTELKVAFHKFMNAPKNTSTGICILCHVIQSCRINHLMTKYGNDCKSYSKKHEIEERLSKRQKGSCLFHLQKFLHKIIAANCSSPMFVFGKELLTKQDTSDSSVRRLNCQRFVECQQRFELQHVIKQLTHYRKFRTTADEVPETLA